MELEYMNGVRLSKLVHEMSPLEIVIVIALTIFFLMLILYGYRD